MRPIIITLLAITSCALSLVSSFPARRVPPAYAAPLKPEGALNSSAQAGSEGKAQTPLVREIDLEGLKKLLARGGETSRPLLVNFWATWCEPCRAEFPDLVKIDSEYRPRGLDFVAVSIDDVSEIKTTVPQFLKEMRAQMPAYLLNTPETDVAIQFVDPQWSGSLPATFLYNREGKIVFKHMGRIKPAELRTAIKTVLSDK